MNLLTTTDLSLHRYIPDGPTAHHSVYPVENEA